MQLQPGAFDHRDTGIPQADPVAGINNGAGADGESLELLDWLDERIGQLDDQVAEAAAGDPAARLLLTHPGVGPVTALTRVVVLGPVRRFPGSKDVASYVGLAPALHASADTHHLGQITKQGNPFLRLVLVQAASVAIRYDEDLHRLYTTLHRRRGHAKAKVAVARKLLIRLFIMCFATASTMTSSAGAGEQRTRCRPDSAPAEPAD
jgi:transposase